jgi:hypothetical protein
MRDAAQWIAHVSGLLPLAAVAWLSLRRAVDPVAVLLGAVFALSFAVDLSARSLSQAGVPNLWLTYVLAPVQFGLLLAVVMPVRYRRIVWGFFGLLVAASLVRATFDSPETFIHVLGGAGVALAAWTQPAFVRYRSGVTLYCAATIPGLLAMGLIAPGWTVEWLAAWGLYQVVRVSALVCITWSILAVPRTRLEVIRDRPRTADAGARGAAGGGVYGTSRARDRPAVY